VTNEDYIQEEILECSAVRLLSKNVNIKTEYNTIIVYVLHGCKILSSAITEEHRKAVYEGNI